MNTGKVLDYMAAEYATTKIRKELLDRIKPVIYEATGLKVSVQEFVTDAVAEKLAQYEEIARKKAAGQTGKKKSA